MEIKICTKCNKERRLSEFHRRKTSPDGHAHWCKSCMKKYHKNWYLEKRNQYYVDNKDKIKERRKEWQLRNLDYMREWRDRNPNYDSRWYKSNKEKCKISNQKWRDKNKDRRCYIEAKHRARKLNQFLLLTIEEKQCVQEIYFICSYINEISTNIKWHIDHIIPLSKGGLHHPDNLQILEALANIRKGDKLVNV